MAVKWLITDGLANTPGGPTYIILDGLNPNEAAPVTFSNSTMNWLSPSPHLSLILWLLVRLWGPDGS